ncbi:MAG TPA: hypothetical protein VNJ01_00120 [Bacteriovoracaceae bacterium]|nr:hypothetical protein [Bacteriovoracaceae bacterium]
MKHMYGLLVLTLLTLGCASGMKPKNSTDTARKLPTSLEEAIGSSYRTAANRERDLYRHPRETLAFFNIRPDMTVVEISPGSGWYMEILAPYLATKGKYYGALPPAGNAYMADLKNKVLDWQTRYPEVGAKMTLTSLNPAQKEEIAPANSADMVLTFRNVHNWMTNGFAQAAFDSFFKALKPGGVLGVVEHRSDHNMIDPKAKSGYVRESDVIAFAEKAGFRLVDESEINSNPLDTKNYPEGVWTLPPTLKLGEKDKDKYLKIGESDRMTLRFSKPKL